MKKYLSLALLIFFGTIFALGTYVVSVKLPSIDQDLSLQTKESIKIDTSKILLGTDEKISINQSLGLKNPKKQESTKTLSTNLENVNSNLTSSNSNLESTNSNLASSNSNLENLNSNSENLIQNQSSTPDKSIEENTGKDSKVISPQTSINNSTQTATEVISQPIQPRYSFLTTVGNISAENLHIAENEIDKLPKIAVDSFVKENWTIRISNENISSNYFHSAYSNVMGVTITDSKLIIIQNRKSSIQSSVVHEFGHYLDWYFDFPSLDAEFSQIYNEEVNTFRSRIPNASCVRDPMEFFAHTFYYLINDSSKCTPKALQFVQTYVNKI